MIDVDRYLSVLGVERPSAPTAEALWVLHRAHAERIPYETTDNQLGRPSGISAEESVARILRGRGGYCFHLNGAFAALLDALGYDVTLHRAGVQEEVEDPDGPGGDHLALTVGLDGQRWLVDIGLAGGIHEPLPLRAGSYTQGPFTYGMAPSSVVPGGWRFTHDSRGAFDSMVFAPEPVTLSSFEEKHAYLSADPESGFVRVFQTQLRDAKGVDMLRGRVLRRIHAEGTDERIIDSAEEFYEVLAEVFHLDLTDMDARERALLWENVTETHAQWLAARQG
ncbi:arylamine N-acetyltransferase [Streptomyces sp. TRM66268-LWL]|uniref:Arylamine N-acetyltransferase n=1 Tax=Streptomyces polyasparticus TaxID=2767826 RepID=A0ABR7SJ45_9ACTN|nr:arylamine N-acetyltransferase [Streptomyces polyasparticus]MBC9715521.1 arylamine N-acetyltransferase [Streptomyces polyasparticus]